MTKQQQIEELKVEVQRLREGMERLHDENDQLKDRLADSLWPVEEQIEAFEQSILKATKEFFDRLRKGEEGE